MPNCVKSMRITFKHEIKNKERYLRYSKYDTMFDEPNTPDDSYDACPDVDDDYVHYLVVQPSLVFVGVLLRV